MKEWLGEGPPLGELVAERSDGRRGSRDTAVVITSYRDRGTLAGHLAALGKQDYRDFDIIIVYGSEDEFVEAPAWAGILHLREKGRNGCAGAFYTGEKAALEEGYKTIILADYDCLPVSKNLVGTLVRGVSEDGGILLPTLENGLGTFWARVPHYYGAFPRKAFETAGLTYLPLFFGGDDVELIKRMGGSGFRISNVEAKAFHPEPLPFFIDTSRRYYYTRGEFEALIIRGSIAGAAVFTLLHMLAACALIAVGRGDIGTMMARGLMDGAAMEFFEKRMPRPAAPGQKAWKRWNAVFRNQGAGRVMTPNMILHNNAPISLLATFGRQMLETLAALPAYFGKTVLVADVSSPANMAVMLVAREAYYDTGRSTVRVFGDRGAAGILFGFLIMLFAVPLSAPLAALLVFAGHVNARLRGASSEAYGAGGKNL